MKNPSKYKTRIKKLLAGDHSRAAGKLLTGQDAVAALVESVLQTDAFDKQAQAAMHSLAAEFVDFNELRVSPPKDIADCIGRDHSTAREKAQIITTALGNIYKRTSGILLDYMANMSKRDLGRHLLDIGLNQYAAAAVLLRVFDCHAIPVDQTLLEVLKMDGLVHPDSDVADVRGFLERIIPHKQALGCHHLLRQHVQKSAGALAKKRKAEEKQRQKEQEAIAKMEAEAAAKAQAQAARKLATKSTKAAEKKRAGTAALKKASAKVAETAKKKAAAAARKRSRHPAAGPARKPVKAARRSAAKK